jgi:hypothetical protein
MHRGDRAAPWASDQVQSTPAVDVQGGRFQYVTVRDTEAHSVATSGTEPPALVARASVPACLVRNRSGFAACPTVEGSSDATQERAPTSRYEKLTARATPTAADILGAMAKSAAHAMGTQLGR